MIIKQVHIDGFGKWHNQDFEFSNNPELIFGPNEAGKTTLLQFILSIFFGFADSRGKNRYDRYIPKNSSSYGGSILVVHRGRKYRIKRSKGKNGGKVTVIRDDGVQGGNEMLQNICGVMDRKLYQTLFSFSQKDLATVDELNRDKWQQNLRQIGAFRSNKWMQLVDDFTKKADHLYKPRGRKWQLNQDLLQYQKISAKINEAKEKYDEYVQLKKELAQAKILQQQEQNQLGIENKKLLELERLQRLMPIYREWQSGKEKLAIGNKELTNSQVLKAQQLQARERAVHQQRIAYQQQLSSLGESHSHLVANGPADLSMLMALKKQVIKLQAQSDYQRTNDKQLQRWQSEQSKIKENYHQQELPAPLTNSEKLQLERLQQNNFTQGFNLTQRQLGIVAAGIFMFLIGLMTNKNLITVLGTLLIVIPLAIVYKQKDQKQFINQVREFGLVHGLHNFPVSQWGSMQADLQRYADLKEQINEASMSKKYFQEQLAELERQLPSEIRGKGLDEVSVQLDQLISKNQQSYQDRQVEDREEITVRQKLAELIDSENQLERQKLSIYALVGVQDDDQFDKYLEERAASQSSKLSTDAYEKQLSQGDREKLSAFASQDKLIEALTEKKMQVNQLSEQIQMNQSKVQKLRVTIASLVTDGSLSELRQERANLETKIWREVQIWLTYKLAVEWIDKSLVLASNDRYPAIIKQAEKYFAILTGHRYQRINLDQEGLYVLSIDQETYDVEELSQGTAEQLYVALRFGFVSVIKDQVNFPVIIDDGFVNFDNQRRQRMLELLNKIAEHNQVIYFTADDRIKNVTAKVIDLGKKNIE